jgi:hypothetical protein
MAGQSGERPGTAEIGAELISLMLPDADPELVQLLLSRAARSAADDRAGHEGHGEEKGDPRAALLQEYVTLIALIRDAGIDRAELCVILELSPEILPVGGDTPHPPIQ